jgi:hypothetical protein
MKITFVILALVLPGLSIGQVRPGFVLGMDADRVQELFGKPIAYYDEDTKTALPLRIGQSVEAKASVQHIYEFKTSFNTYQFSLRYDYDTAQSRLHPTKRLRLVRIELDKKVPLVKLLDLLEDMPDARELCANECRVRIETGLATVQVYVQPTRTTQQGAQLADAIFNEWGPIRYTGCSLALRFLVDEGPSIASGWLQSLAPDPPEVRKNISVRELGTWKPGQTAK